MSDQRRIIEVYLEVEKGTKEVTVDGFDVSAPLTFYRNTRAVVRAHLRRSNRTYLTPPAGTTWFFGLDNSFDPGHADPVFTQNDEFNLVADWTDVSPENGKICWRVNTSTVQLETAMGTSEVWTPQPHGEIWMTPPGVSSVLLCQWKVTVRNIVSEIEADTDLEYYENGLFRSEGNDVVLFFPDGSVAQRWSKS